MRPCIQMAMMRNQKTHPTATPEETLIYQKKLLSEETPDKASSIKN